MRRRQKMTVSVCVWKHFLKSGDEQKRERPCREKGKQQSLEEKIDFSAFHLHPTSLRSTHRCSVGTFSLTAGRRSAHMRVCVYERAQKGVEILLVKDEGVCAYLRYCGVCVCEDALVMGT